MLTQAEIAFGPVPSRRLGRSLGINNLPPKPCSYSCIYCQVGQTRQLRCRRLEGYRPEVVVAAVEAKLEWARQSEEGIDALTFVPDGESTLDLHLGEEMLLLRRHAVRIAVISNGSLIDRADVRRDLSHADWVSLKVDAVEEGAWRRINRPHRSLRLEAILRGALEFRREFHGVLATETMLVDGVNARPDQIEALAGYLRRLGPTRAYLAVPTRPPAEPWVRPPSEAEANQAFQILAESGVPVELMIGSEGDAFASSGDTAADLLSVTAVHPMRRSAVDRLLERNGDSWSTVERLVAQGRLIPVDYRGERFYLRRLHATAGGLAGGKGSVG